MPNRLFTLVLTGCLLLLSGACSSTYVEEVAAVRAAHFRGDIASARTEIRALLADEGDGDGAALYRLEEAIVELSAGDPARAEDALNWSRERLEDREGEELAAFGGDVAAYFTDDRFTVYAGQDHEKILIPFFAALANLLRDGEDAVAYANQVLLTQNRILDQELPGSGRKFKDGYRKVGAGAYLYGLITEDRDPTAGGEVRASYQRVKDWEPQFSPIEGDLARVSEGVHSQKGNGVLYVIALVGKGPEKIELEITDVAFATELTLQLSRLIPAIGRNFGPTLDFSPIKVSHLQARADNVIERIGVRADSGPAIRTATLTDVTATAVQQFQQVREWIVARALLRRMVKKAIVTAAKGVASQAIDRDRRNDLRRDGYRPSAGSRDKAVALAALEVGGALINTIWSATERADTRHWSLLPDEIQSARLELPVGAHRITMVPELKHGGQGLPREIDVEIRPSENTYVILFVPEPGVGPAPRTSRPAREAPSLARD